MIKVKTRELLKDFDGTILKNGEKDLTIGMAVSLVMGGDVSNSTLGWILGKKFACDKEVDLLAEEVVFVKKEMDATKVWNAVVRGQVLEMLDGKPESPKK